MPAYLKVFLYLALTFLIGAAIAPPIFWAGQALASSGVSGWLAGFPFHRVLSRCLQVTGIVLLWPALRWVGLRSLSQLHLRKNALALPDGAFGFVSAAVVVGALAGVCVAAGFFVLRPDPSWAAMGKIALTAAFVSALEEAIFRGVILGVCLWTLPRRGAVFLTALLFAAVHFIKPSKTALAPSAVEWWSGFSEAVRFSDGLPAGPLLVYGFVSLFVAGWILGSSAARTSSLWLPFGLHAGWIFSQQTTNLFLRPADPLATLPWVGPNLVSGAVPTGVLPVAALVLTGVLVGLYLRHVFRPGPRVS